MNEKELRELDTWIVKNVMGWNFITSGAFPDNDVAGVPPTSSGLHHPIPRHSTDPAAAMQVLERCAEKTIVEVTAVHDGSFRVRNQDRTIGDGMTTYDKSFPLAICLFAQKLFSK